MGLRLEGEEREAISLSGERKRTGRKGGRDG